jgi:hypothetical protein
MSFGVFSHLLEKQIPRLPFRMTSWHSPTVATPTRNGQIIAQPQISSYPIQVGIK